MPDPVRAGALKLDRWGEAMAGLAPSTQNTKIAAVRAFFEYLIFRGLPSHRLPNPAKEVPALFQMVYSDQGTKACRTGP